MPGTERKRRGRLAGRIALVFVGPMCAALLSAACDQILGVCWGRNNENEVGTGCRGLVGLRSQFEFKGAEVADVRVAARAVVELLDVLADGGGTVGPGREEKTPSGGCWLAPIG
jgi:hypothetical protein